jgi:hypothetical protein
VATTRGRLWPDERQALLLRAGLCPGPLAIAAWQRVSPGLDLAALDRGAARLLPLVWSHLRRHGLEVDALAARYRDTRAANTRLLDQLGETLAPLHEAGIATMLLKGPALLVSAYADAGERPMSDLDVLVPADRVADAARSLQARGWTAEATMTPAVTRLTHSVSFRHPRHVSLDLHWHVFEECCRPADDEPLWAASVPVTVGDAATRIPAAEDQLLHVCVHGEKWVQVPGIRWIADAVTLLRRDRVRWDRLVAEAVRRRFVLRMQLQLDYLRSTFDAPIPAEALAALAAAPVSRIERFEHRWSVRDRRRPWALVYWCNHRRSAPGGLPGAALTFPRYLQAVWHLETLRSVPGAAIRRLLRRAHPPAGLRPA